MRSESSERLVYMKHFLCDWTFVPIICVHVNVAKVSLLQPSCQPTLEVDGDLQFLFLRIQ